MNVLTDQLGPRNTLVRLGCILMIAAAGLRAFYAGVFESPPPSAAPSWIVQWAAAYLIFVLCYAASESQRRWQSGLLITQSVAVLYLIWLYPSFLVTALMVVVAWQIAWAMPLRRALIGIGLLTLALTIMKCVDQVEGMSLLVLVTTSGFQLFAVSAAHLARSEAQARESLARANAELRATHALLTESARMAERLRISRDLHDVMGHSLTSLTIRLDVASRLAQGEAAEHLQCARGIAADLLNDVRAIVRQVRVQPVDLRATLHSLTEGLVELKAHLILPEQLSPLDPARADAILRCVQEVITNTLRHADASELTIELQQRPDGELVITAYDDGRGGEVVAGQGLAGMRERFEMLGGSLAIAGQPGRGLRIHGQIPAGALP